MENQFSRNELYWGKDFQNALKNKKIAVFGLGGVGGYALDALCRAGIEHFIITDFDSVSITNINRQLVALHSNVGKKKTELFEKRLKDINPNVKIECVCDFADLNCYEKILGEESDKSASESADKIENKVDFVLDAIDTLKSKIELISFCTERKIPIVSSFGAGNRFDCTKLYLTEFENFVPKCNFSKNVVSKLKKVGIVACGATKQDLEQMQKNEENEKGAEKKTEKLHKNLEKSNFWVVSSTEKPQNIEKIENIEKIMKKNGEKVEFKKFTPASTPCVPAVAGYFMANCVIKNLYDDFLSAK